MTPEALIVDFDEDINPVYWGDHVLVYSAGKISKTLSLKSGKT